MTNLCLGIESTAHTFGASLVQGKSKPGSPDQKGQVLSNTKDVFTTKKGGMIPRKVAEHHLEVFDTVIEQALDQANKNIKDIDFITYSRSPGIGNTLRIGWFVSKQLSKQLKIPIIGVNHCLAHLEIGKLTTGCTDPVMLYASGANTQIIAFEGSKYRIFGETLDLGVGNFIDSFARDIGLGFPGGPKIEQLAKKSRKYVELPYTVKGMDMSFGGLQTNLKQKIQARTRLDYPDYSNEDLCFSMQETVFAMLIEVSERALAHCNKQELLLAGGVACNSRLQQMAQDMTQARRAKCFVPEKQFLVDNAAMIAWIGLVQFNALNKKQQQALTPEKADFDPYERTDDVDAWWVN